jgi:hypothetical protein
VHPVPQDRHRVGEGARAQVAVEGVLEAGQPLTMGRPSPRPSCRRSSDRVWAAVSAVTRSRRVTNPSAVSSWYDTQYGSGTVPPARPQQTVPEIDQAVSDPLLAVTSQVST